MKIKNGYIVEQMGCPNLTYYEESSNLNVVYSRTLGVEKPARELFNFKRKSSAGTYRYGFQGQEKDNEVKGNGNSVNYKYRMHDSRLGRFFAVDPLASDFAWNSPYAFSENRVIDAIELEGLEKLSFMAFTNEIESAHIEVTRDVGIQYDFNSKIIYFQVDIVKYNTKSGDVTGGRAKYKFSLDDQTAEKINSPMDIRSYEGSIHSLFSTNKPLDYIEAITKFSKVYDVFNLEDKLYEAQQEINMKLNEMGVSNLNFNVQEVMGNMLNILDESIDLGQEYIEKNNITISAGISGGTESKVVIEGGEKKSKDYTTEFTLGVSKTTVVNKNKKMKGTIVYEHQKEKE